MEAFLSLDFIRDPSQTNKVRIGLFKYSIIS